MKADTKKDIEIAKLKKQVAILKEENNYLKSPLYLFEITEQIQERYSILLSPPSKALSTTNNQQKNCVFKFDINDIVCIQSDGKLKWIYFSKQQESDSGARLVSDKLHYTGSFEEFCNQYDQPRVHLCIVSRSAVVNPTYYHLDGKKLKLSGKINPQGKCNNIPISQRFVKGFVERQETLKTIRSFQKIRFHSK